MRIDHICQRRTGLEITPSHANQFRGKPTPVGCGASWLFSGNNQLSPSLFFFNIDNIYYCNN